MEHTTGEIALLTRLETLIGEPTVDLGTIIGISILEFQFPRSTHIYEVRNSFGAALHVYIFAIPKSVSQFRRCAPSFMGFPLE